MAAVYVKFICLLLVLLFSSAWLSSAHEAAEDDAAMSTEKKGVVDSVLNGNVATRNEIGGKKMIPRKVIVKRVEIKGNEALAETIKISSENQETVAGKSGNKGKKKKKKKKNAAVNEESKPRVSNIPEQLNNEAGFVAFSADYHSPRHHPPKNN
ncbi:hypothetical protein P3X46_023127 [Hevea brasiliensis]|nr:protein GOLVEN 5 [Hevea brasiliensis]KAJ9163461.1 hypothetical protein P3X46_023127 [Hevea brasiliensis]